MKAKQGNLLPVVAFHLKNLCMINKCQSFAIARGLIEAWAGDRPLEGRGAKFSAHHDLS